MVERTADSILMEESKGYHRNMTRKDLLGGYVLVDDNQQIHIMINSPGAATLNCPTDCRWTGTRDQKVQITQKVMEITGEEEGCCNLLLNKILVTMSNWNMPSTAWGRESKHK